MIDTNKLPSVMTIVGLVIAALFVIFGLYVIFAPQLRNIPSEFRNIFGVVIIGYGAFRTVIIIQKSKQRKEAEDESEF